MTTYESRIAGEDCDAADQSIIPAPLRLKGSAGDKQAVSVQSPNVEILRGLMCDLSVEVAP